MQRVNVSGSHAVADAAHRHGARLVVISTDVLFDGTAAPYGDAATPTPINHYGRTKAEGEAEALTAHPDALAVRTSLMYATDEMDRGTQGFADMLAAGDRPRLFTDVVRNPIWVETLAEAVLRLAATDAAGTLNVAGETAMTRYEYAEAMLGFWGVDTDGRLDGVPAADVAPGVPRDLRLDSSTASGLIDMAFPGVPEVLSGRQAPPDGA